MTASNSPLRHYAETIVEQPTGESASPVLPMDVQLVPQDDGCEELLEEMRVWSLAGAMALESFETSLKGN